METVSIHKAKAQLSGLVSAVEEHGERVVLCRYGKPVAEIVPFREGRRTLHEPSLAPVRYSGSLTAATTDEWEHV